MFFTNTFIIHINVGTKAFKHKKKLKKEQIPPNKK